MRLFFVRFIGFLAPNEVTTFGGSVNAGALTRHGIGVGPRLRGLAVRQSVRLTAKEPKRIFGGPSRQGG